MYKCFSLATGCEAPICTVAVAVVVVVTVVVVVPFVVTFAAVVTVVFVIEALLNQQLPH